MGRRMIARPDRWRRFMLLGIVAVVATLLVTSFPIVPANPFVLAAQPALLDMARQQPESMLSVIVQKWADDDSAERLVAQFGGTVRSELPMIRAFAAEIPSAAVAQLASSPGVRWLSLDAAMAKNACTGCIDTSALQSAFIAAIGADRLWNEGPYIQGQGVSVAVVDSGIDPMADFASADGTSRIVARFTFVGGCIGNRCMTDRGVDLYGHGTAMAGIIGANGSRSSGRYLGAAPKVNLVNVKVCDQNGVGRTSDVIEGLQWIYDHKAQYNIRVVNLSLNSTTPESYRTSPLDAALEILWFNRIIVVVSAGNNGASGVIYPPANDPFVITVGAADDRGTPRIADDVVAPFSAYGRTESGFAKPDLVAPGVNVVSVAALPSRIVAQHRDHLVGSPPSLRLSGTSVASAVTAGATALLVQANPRLTPDQVKHRLMATAHPLSSSGARLLDVYAAVHASTRQSANTGIAASPLLRTGSDPITWNSLNWDSLNWDSLNWDSINWDSLNWDSLNWDSDYWGE